MNDESNDVIERVSRIIATISTCRIRYLARALTALTLMLGSVLAAFTATLIPNYFISDVVIGTSLLIILILVYSFILFETFKRSFKYTFNMASLAGEEIKLLDLLLFPAVMLIVIFFSRYFNSPQLLMSSPFIALAIVKIISREKERIISGTVLMSLSMLCVASKEVTLPAALASAYAISSTFETLINLEEAEKCVRLRQGKEVETTSS